MQAGLEISEKVLTVVVGKESTLFGANIFVEKDGLKGWTGAKFRRQEEPKMMGHGNYRVRGWRDARLVSISGEFWTDTRAEAAALQDEFALILGDGTEGELHIVDPDQGARWCRNVSLVSAELDWDTDLTGKFALDIHCPDPRKFAETPVTSTTGIQKSETGLVFPLFVPDNGLGGDVLDFGPTMGSSGIASVTNPGSAPSSVLFRINGGGNPNGFVITEQETGRRLVYDFEVPASQELILDSADGTVWLMGYAPREQGLTTRQWMEIPAGATRTYHFDGRDGGEFSELTVEVYPTWW